LHLQAPTPPQQVPRQDRRCDIQPGSNKSHTMAALLEIEKWPCYDSRPDPNTKVTRDYFACNYCLKIRSSQHFPNTMMRGAKGNASQSRDKHFRFCIDCAIKHRTWGYLSGTWFEYGGARLGFGPDGLGGGLGVVCRGCGLVKGIECDEEQKQGSRAARLGMGRRNVKEGLLI
jgi:hypothetical protein